MLFVCALTSKNAATLVALLVGLCDVFITMLEAVLSLTFPFAIFPNVFSAQFQERTVLS